jgi:hypothetical protein
VLTAALSVAEATMPGVILDDDHSARDVKVGAAHGIPLATPMTRVDPRGGSAW